MATTDREYQNLLRQLGENIQKKRKEAGLTQEAMEEPGHHAIDVKYIQRIERGRNITVRTLFKISKRLGISIHDLFDFQR